MTSNEMRELFLKVKPLLGDKIELSRHPDVKCSVIYLKGTGTGFNEIVFYGTYEDNVKIASFFEAAYAWFNEGSNENE